MLTLWIQLHLQIQLPLQFLLQFQFHLHSQPLLQWSTARKLTASKLETLDCSKTILLVRAGITARRNGGIGGVGSRVVLSGSHFKFLRRLILNFLSDWNQYALPVQAERKSIHPRRHFPKSKCLKLLHSRFVLIIHMHCHNLTPVGSRTE